jgi:MtaA/CmuA family methyltransferase
MSKKEQFLRLMNGQTQDRPQFYPILMHFAARYGGKTYGELASDYRVLVESNIRCLEDFDLDMVSLISDPYRETAAFGAPVEFVREGVPKCLKTIVSSPEDIASLKNPDVYASTRTLDRINGARYYRMLVGDRVPVMGWVEGPLAEACALTGVSDMLIMLMTDPGNARLLMEKCLVTAKDFARAQVEAGCDLIGIGDAICSQIDLSSYDQFVFPLHKELVEYIHSLNVYVKLHICGNTTHLWPSLCQLNVDIFDLDYMANPEKAFRYFGPDVTRAGNINPVDIQNMSALKIFEISQQLLEKEKGRRFMLSGGCEITVGTPAENLYAMRKACNNI